MDSWVQPNRGEVGCGPVERAAETEAACKLLRCDVMRLGLRDDNVTQGQIEEKFLMLRKTMLIHEVYGPALHQNGNFHHNMVAMAADRVWGKAVQTYTSYRKDELYITGNIEIVPSPGELDLKAQALACYTSQLRVNRPHFDAVMGKSEWLQV